MDEIYNFFFNDCGVCTNPDIVEEYRDGKVWFNVDVAQQNGKWRYGGHAQTLVSGYATPCSFTRKRTYPSKREATLAGLRYMQRWFIECYERETSLWQQKTTQGDKILKALKHIRHRIFDNSQLQLFE